MFFAVFWLYFDAWTGRKTLKDFTRWLAFLLLSISFILSAIYVESTIVTDSFIQKELHFALIAFIRILGYSVAIVSLILDPLMEKPKLTPINAVIPVGIKVPLAAFASFAYPILAGLAGFLYLRRATVGLENHLKPVAFTFFVLSFAEFLSLGFLLQSTTNTVIYNFVAPFGVLWIGQHLVVLVSILILRRWIFGYLLKRFQSQLFIIFTTSIVAIFLITTVAFSALLLRNMEEESLAHLKTDVNILQYSVDSKKAETLSDAQVVAVNPEIKTAVLEGNRKTLKELATSILLTKKQSTLLILSESGVVLARGEDPDRLGDSLSDDPLMSRMYQKIFSFENYEIVQAADGEEGLEKAKTTNPTIILLDVMMPKMNGLQVLDKLKLDPDTKGIPVIMLTNLAGQQDAETALAKGAVKYIVKSEHEPKQVAGMVKEILAGYTRNEVPKNS